MEGWELKAFIWSLSLSIELIHCSSSSACLYILLAHVMMDVESMGLVP